MGTLNNNLKYMNIVMASDDNGIDMMSVAIYSIMKNNPKTKLLFWILFSDISSYNQSKLKKLTQSHNKATINFISVEIERFKNVELTNKTVTMPAYYRYLTPFILKDEDKALYVDIDILCLKNLSALYDINLENQYIAAVEDYFVSKTDDYHGFKQGIGFNKEDPYINSGLQLMNLELLRYSGVMDKFWSNLKRKSEIIPKPYNIFADQTVTNITFKEKLKILDDKYNTIVSSIQYTNQKDVVIAHFAGPDKPFTCFDEKSQYYSDIYLDYYLECMHITGDKSFRLIRDTMHKVGSRAFEVIKKLDNAESLARDKSHHVEELLSQLEKENNNNITKVKLLEDKINTMENSISWKITKPMREIIKVKSKFKK